MNLHPAIVDDRQAFEELDVAPEVLEIELRLETFCHAFLKDGANATDVARRILCEGAHSYDEPRLYREAIVALVKSPDFEMPVPSCDLAVNAAWLLKDVGGLTYAQIAEVLQSSPTEVGRGIHEVR